MQQQQQPTMESMPMSQWSQGGADMWGQNQQQQQPQQFNQWGGNWGLVDFSGVGFCTSKCTVIGLHETAWFKASIVNV